jgi:hypothetical protein
MVVRQPWDACQTSQKLFYCLPRFLCMKNGCTASRNPYGTACSSLLFATLKSVLACCLGMRAQLCKRCLFLLQLDLLFSQQECLNNPQWVRPLALIDLMREGEGFSNLTIEIRLDGWLRFGVSSLTLTLVIKSPFNLHLTN